MAEKAPIKSKNLLQKNKEDKNEDAEQKKENEAIWEALNKNNADLVATNKMMQYVIIVLLVMVGSTLVSVLLFQTGILLDKEDTNHSHEFEHKHTKYRK